jgi:PIN domain nuclease of toxin-antitoxin system
VKLLLDTHALIWFYEMNRKMSATALALILDPANDKLVSPAAYWEMAIKLGTGKLVLAEPFPDFVQHAIFDNGFTILPVEPRHCFPLPTLPRHHNDPFDRLMIAQAIVEDIAVVSIDTAFDPYPVRRLW